jgi:hypothetical protein
MSTDFASALLAELRVYTAPLEWVAYSPDPLRDLRILLRRCGWLVTTDVDAADITDTIDTVVVAIVTMAEDLVPDDLGEILERIELVHGVVQDLRDLGSSIAALGATGPPDADAAGALAEDLAHHLTLTWLESKADVLDFCDLVGLTAWVEVDERSLGWLVRPARRQRRVVPAALPALLADPQGLVVGRLAPDGWVDQERVAGTLLSLGTVLDPLLGGRGWHVDPRGPEYGVDRATRPVRADLAVPLPTDVLGTTVTLAASLEGFSESESLASGASGPGVSLSLRGGTAADLEVLGWTLAVTGALDLDGPIEIRPSGVDLGGGTEASIDVVATRQVDVLLGAGRTGFTLGTLELSAGASADSNDPGEVRFGVAARESSIGISTRDFGDAIAKVLPLDVLVPFDLGLEWSSRTGLSLAGSAALEIELADEVSIAGGAFVVRNVALGLELGDDITIAVTGDVYFSLNVLQAVVEGVGLGVTIRLGGDGTGSPIALAIDLPDAVGLTVVLEAITGGGYLAIDHEIGRYSGALAIEVVTIGIRAITVIDTQLPGNPDGFAVFASLTITFPGIPLGFGFVLTGLGGIVAINRTLDAEALATGLRNGVIDSLLFPKDPIGDAAQLIAQIDDYFPLMEGNAVFGPVVEIGWGTPTPLVTAQLGVVISIPDAVIAVLGSISALLPTPAAPLITLHLDVLGVIDIPAGEMSLVASLYDSRLLATIDLSGDMAMYVRATSQPYFLLSVGGYHPAFQPPSNLPAAMHDLRRMTASIEIASNVAVMIQSYFALTSNTVQFGASVNVEAAVEIWPTTYSARGWFEFNVMLQFDPFKILADMSAGVAVYSGNKELLGVQLSVQLEGPEPWYLVGNATFKFFGVKVKFDVEVGSKAAGEPKPTVPLRDQVLAELAAGGSWSEAGPADGLAAGIIFGALDPAATGDTIWVRPDHQLSVTQSVAPFDRDIEVVGQALPAAGHERLTVTAAGIGTVADTQSATVEDWFAPAQYEAMSSTERLTRASFELMPAGVAFGSADAVVPEAGDCTNITTGYESETWAPDTDPVEASRRLAGVHESMRFTPGRTTPMFTLAATEFTVVNAVDGTIGFPDGVSGVIGPTALARGVSQRTALDATAAALAANPALASSVKVVPVSALVTAAAAQP